MNIELNTPTRSERVLIRRMMELYLYDFSEFTGDDLDEHGLFGYGDLDYFWFEPTHAAYLVRIDGQLGGFVLVDNEVIVEGSQRSITEFIILRKYRRQAVGRQVANQVFDLLPAKWGVRVIEAAAEAFAFWRRVIGEYTQGKITETTFDNDDWEGPVFTFDNRKAE